MKIPEKNSFNYLCLEKDYEQVHNFSNDTVDKVYYNLYWHWCSRFADDLKDCDELKKLKVCELDKVFKNDKSYWKYLGDMDTACRAYFGYMYNLYKSKTFDDYLNNYFSKII